MKKSQSDLRAYWSEMAPCDHIVQIYDHDAEFLDGLESFIADGFKKEESVVVIATGPHLDAMNQRLRLFDLARLRAADHYIPLDAKDTLSDFMVNHWPDETLFDKSITEILARASRTGRPVRAFGEMVALLWGQGHNAATIRLEHLWNNLIKRHRFPVFCAYPRSGHKSGAAASMKEICSAHSKVLPSSSAS